MACLLELLKSFIHENKLTDAKLLVGYSGGVDSHVLLHALSSLRTDFLSLNIRACYIHHGLLKEADAWEEHCRKTCNELNLPFESISVTVSQKKGESLEAQAREARYQAFKSIIKPGEYLCLAQHQDDQVETFLLQLFRGAGIKGLSAMPARARFGEGFLLRPFLRASKETMLEYANKHHLDFCEDPSNQDVRFDRNFLRHKILPQLKKRWPGMSKTITRSAQHCADANSLLHEFMQQTFSEISSDDDCLSLAKIQDLNVSRKKQVLRLWLNEHLSQLPSEKQLEQILGRLIDAKADATPEVKLGQKVLRRFRNTLYITDEIIDISENWESVWNLTEPLCLPGNLGELVALSKTNGFGLRQDIASVTVRFRQGGERCRLSGRGQSQRLKNLFQEWNIPPWERSRIPLLYVGDELALVVGHAICEGFVAEQDVYQIDLTSSPP